MGTLSLRLPHSLHARARELAQREGISLNQFVTTAVAEKVSALWTEEYLESRARRGSRPAYLAALARVPNEPPLAGDELSVPRRKRRAAPAAARRKVAR